MASYDRKTLFDIQMMVEGVIGFSADYFRVCGDVALVPMIGGSTKTRRIR